ncbi:MAG: hypothetical protein ILA24_00735 [Ruminococcus sp.]|nr:hypothetical protein [Ruminococcus sp.]
MKRRLMAAVMCVCMLFASCGESEKGGGESDVSFSQQSESITSSRQASESEAADSDGRQVLTLDINNDKKPELTKVELSGKCSGNIERKASLSESMHVLHNRVVGLIGSPIEVKYDGVDDGQIAFYYNKSELRGVPEKNLVLLYCTAPNEPYNTVTSAKLDTQKCVVSAAVQGKGVYLLADAYQWYGAWGEDVSEYAYERDTTSYKTDWEREFDTGSIMKLADKDWAQKNAPDFHVSTAQQLASVVYYVNGLNPTYKNVSVTLENDIDLTGYDWRPMGWSHASNHAFCGTVNGQGHYIKGMKIKVGYEPCGFIGYGWDAVMQDISFINADVTGTHSTGIAGGEIYSSSVWSNVYVQGKVSGGGKDYGAIIGREASIAFKKCSADVTMNGKPLEYFSFKQKQTAETPVVETFHLTLNKDMSITRDDHEGFRNLGWIIEKDGVQILDRSATAPFTNAPELTLSTDVQWFKGSEGKFRIYLTASGENGYVRVSNVIEYTN